MGKPSIFSREYEVRMRRRKLNITLFILILVFAGFFGARYYLNEHNINISLKMPWFNEIFKNKDSGKKNTDKNNGNTTPNNKINNGGTTQPTQPADKVEIKFYEYKNAVGKVIKIQYNQSLLGNEITGIQSDGEVIASDISTDKKKIVFEDKSNGNIILTDNAGISKIVSPDSYKSKSAGIVIKKDVILKNNPSYVWAQKPHFTSDGKIVFISQLPYIKGSDLYLWFIRDDGSVKMVGKLGSTDIQKISYSGFDVNGALKININGVTYYLAPGEYRLKK